MANSTLPDITLSTSFYADVYALTGIAQGTSLILQNKSTTSFNIQVKDSAPSATNSDGNILTSYEFLVVAPDKDLKCFAKGNGKLSVQIAE